MKCEYEKCGKEFEPERATARYCSPKCRVSAGRAAKKVGGTIVPLGSGLPQPYPEGLGETRRVVKNDRPYMEAKWEEMPAPEAPLKVPPCKPGARAIPSGHGEAPRKKVHVRTTRAEALAAQGDVNALAREVAKRVPVRKQHPDSLEARMTRLEQAMKQFSKKKAPAEKKGGEL